MFLDNKVQLNIINTNARSLRPKINSFIDYFNEIEATIGIVTETWFSDGEKLDKQAEDLLLGSGIGGNFVNRKPGNAGFSHGGVAVLHRENCTRAKLYKFANPSEFEVLPVCMSVNGIKRKLVVIGVYIPPGYTVAKGKDCLQYVNDLVLDIKTKVEDPLICVGGDFNQWGIGDSLVDYPDLAEILTPPTRDTRRIDKIYINWLEDLERADCLPPLETLALDESGRKAYSDHLVQVAFTRLPRKEPVKWESFQCRPYTKSGAETFKQEIRSVDWSYVLGANGSNDKANALQIILDDLMDKHFPTKTVRRKENDLPWFNDIARKMSRRKNAIFKSEGNCPRWQRERDKLEDYLAKRRHDFLYKQKDMLTRPEANKRFFQIVKKYNTVDRPAQFDVRNLRPGKTDQEVADELATYFNRISQEFSPLQPHEIPSTYDRDLPPIGVAEAESMIRKSKKKLSRVPGDIFPQLLNDCAGDLAIPLADIYSEILRSFVWPVAWKKEYVTVIPKKNMPEDFGDLRNISCTLKFSKIFEAYLLERATEEIEMKHNQYGGMKGCSTTHMIIDVLQEICANAEDYRSATVLSAIDYAKAFNRVSFQHCLEAFRRKGSSTRIIRLIASFLTNRTMVVRVGNVWSEPLDVTGGCPQGSILGVLIFNTTTDDLEDEFEALEARRIGLPESAAGSGDDVRVIEEPTAQRSLGPATSSPTSDLPPPNMDLSPVVDRLFRLGERHIEFRPNVINKPLPDAVMVTPPVEVKTGTQVLVDKPVMTVKYIDDNLSSEKLNFGRVPITKTNDGENIKTKQAINLQNCFRSVTREAEKRGMVVNVNKTKLLCISDALNYTPKAFIEDSEGNKIWGGESLKVLGFTFSTRPTVQLHVSNTVKSMRRRNWSLRHLKKLGLSQEDLVAVYTSTIRAIPDYCAPAYHSMTTDLMDQELEQAQVSALRSIYGYGDSGRKLRQKAGIDTLRDRRISLTDNFAAKCVGNPRFKKWFPPATGRRSGRSQEKYREEFAKNDRLKNSPLFYMRRRMNGKEGKIYGERNRIYRENLNN